MRSIGSKQYHNTIVFFGRLLMTFSLLALIYGGLLFHKFQKYSHQNAQASLNQQSKTAELRLEEARKSIEANADHIASEIYFSPTFMKSLSTNKYHAFEAMSVLKMISSQVYIQSDIDEIVFNWQGGGMIFSARHGVIEMDSPILKNPSALDIPRFEERTWQFMPLFDFSETSSMRLCFILRINNPQGNNHDHLIFYLKKGFIEDFVSQDENTSHVITNDASNIVWPLDQAGNPFITPPDRSITTTVPVGYNWYLQSKQDVSLWDSVIRQGIGISIAMLLLLLIFYFVFVLLFVRSYIPPLEVLIQKMEEIKDGSFVRIEDQSRNDEFGIIYSRFNNMSERLETLFNQVYKEKMSNQELQLKNLQSKINPHFIYNIFENMNWMVELQRYDELRELLGLLGEYYREVFASQDSVIPLEDEFLHLENYLAIQKIRYPKRLHYTLEVSEELTGTEIPSGILQPLVENSIVHGLDCSDEGIEIDVSSYAVENGMEISVKDNGARFTAQDTIELLNKIRDGSSPSALKTIYNRLNLIYKTVSVLRIESNDPKGLSVILHLPRNDAGEL